MIAYPTPKQLHYFIVAAQTGSFTKAAAQCSVTQSTLSAGIQELESILGGQLFDRIGRKTYLSALGESLLPQAQTIMDELNSMSKHAKLSLQPMSGPLRLGVIPTMAPYILPKLLPYLSKTYPNLSLTVHEDVGHQLVENMAQGQLDMAIMSPLDTKGNYETHIVSDEPFYLALPSDIAPRQRHIAATDLKRYRLLLLGEEHCLHQHALKAAHIEARPSDKQFSANTLQTLVQLVHEGYGATLIPQMTIANGLTQGLNVKIYAVTDPIPTRTICVMHPKHSSLAHDAATLATHIKMTLECDLNDKGRLSSNNLEHSVPRQSQAV